MRAFVLCVFALICVCLSGWASAQSDGVVSYTGAVFNGAFTTWVNNPSAFCGCHYGGPCVYVCAGGGTAGNAQNCDTNACANGQYSFSANTGFQIKVQQTGSPYRAFGYAELCGQNNQNTACLSNGAVFTMSFMLQNAASWTGYVKLLFFGDGNNLIGYWPNVGSGAGTGQNSLVIFPNGDLPTSWQAAIPLKDSVWYDVTVTINTFNSLSMSIVENGPTGRVTYSGSGYSSTAVSASAPPQFGCYTWANTAGPQFSVFVNNICAGNAGSCVYSYNTAAATTTAAPSSSTSTSTTTTTRATTTTSTTKATTTTIATTSSKATTSTAAASASSSSSSTSSQATSSTAAQATSSSASTTTTADPGLGGGNPPQSSSNMSAVPTLSLLSVLFCMLAMAMRTF